MRTEPKLNDRVRINLDASSMYAGEIGEILSHYGSAYLVKFTDGAIKFFHRTRFVILTF